MAVHADEMADQDFQEVEGDAGEEEGKEGGPGDSLEEGSLEVLVTETEADDDVCEWCLVRLATD